MESKVAANTQVNTSEYLNCPDSIRGLIDLNQVALDESGSHDTQVAQKKKRTNRIEVQGCPNWQIDPNGTLYYKRRKATPDGKSPMIDLGPSAFPPVVPAHGDGSRERFVDELVCWHFHERLSFTQQKYAHTLHFDGDWGNCAADNVRQVLDAEYAEYAWHRKMRSWMASDIPSKRLKIPGAATFGGTRNDATPNDLRADGEITTLPGWAEVVPVWVRDRIKAEQEKACA